MNCLFKRKILLVGLIIITFNSCQNSDDTNIVDQKQSINSRPVANSDYTLYKHLVGSFFYDNSLPYLTNVSLFEIYVNTYFNNVGNSFQKIDRKKLSEINNDPISVLNELNYSTEFKDALNDILNDRSISNVQLASYDENVLIHTLYALYSDSDDYLKRNIKTIAFAYGAQYNVTKAILYAGAVELKK